jgi:hypothetical protein
LQAVTRELHASVASKLATEEIPQLHRFLIEDSDVRDRWAFIIGEIAESHHWSLNDLEKKFATKTFTPTADGSRVDVTYLACLLRVIDFAHINRERADRVDRLLRNQIEPSSEIHWDAQKDITGPCRVGEHLVFGCTKPLSHVEAWWHFYDTVVSLDSEIKGVYELLRGRTISQARFSLQGVKGAEQPEMFNRFVRLLNDIVPLDIRVKTDSMDRVVELLGGRQLYGHDQVAPLRELIQNARDAVELRMALDKADKQATRTGEILIALQASEDGTEVLTIRDNGVGMSRNVVLRHLLSVGSDFWGSVDFYDAYGRALTEGFKPIGKFGIGFLSVFMLGTDVEVETEALGSKRLLLHLRGVGRRGELREVPCKGITGTEVRILLSAGTKRLFKELPRIVRARAPMLRIPIRVTVYRPGVPPATEEIVPGWWKDADADYMLDFVNNWHGLAFGPIDEERLGRYIPHSKHGNTSGDGLGRWPSSRPEYVDDGKRLISEGSDSPGVLMCSQGIAVHFAQSSDMFGIAEVGQMDLTVSRETVTSNPITVVRCPRRLISDGVPHAFYSSMVPKIVAGLEPVS